MNDLALRRAHEILARRVNWARTPSGPTIVMLADALVAAEADTRRAREILSNHEIALRELAAARRLLGYAEPRKDLSGA